jgi:hypothetical protein
MLRLGGIASPPAAIMRIGDQRRYRQYRPAEYVVRRRPVPVNRIQRPVVVRDDRARDVRDHDDRRDQPAETEQESWLTSVQSGDATRRSPRDEPRR